MKLGTRLKRYASTALDPSSYLLLFATLGIRAGLLRSVVPDKERETESVRSPRAIPPAAVQDIIPLTVFQTWKTRGNLPTNYAHWSESFRKLNPGFTALVWDDADNREFIAKEFPWFLPQYDAYPKEIFRADIVRPFFLFHHGGIYADMDTECLTSLDEITRSGDVLLGWMGRDRSFAHSLPNAIMASKPGQLFWLFMVAMAIERFQACASIDEMRGLGPEKLTGPVLLRDTYLEYISLTESEVRTRIDAATRGAASKLPAIARTVTVLPSSSWYAVNWNNPVHELFRQEMLSRQFLPSRSVLRKLFPGAAMVTYWTHSW